MDAKEIKQRRYNIEEQRRILHEEYLAKDNVLHGELYKLQQNCSHEHMSSAPYLRWCTDCGKDWSTT